MGAPLPMSPSLAPCSHYGPLAARVGSPKNRTRQIPEEFRSELQVANVDALVGGVDQRRGLEEGLVALGKETIGEALGEGGAEVARVGAAGEDDGHDLGTRVALGDPAGDGLHQRRVRGGAVADHALGELDLEARRAVGLAEYF